jgi:heme exporter protein CcmD
MDALSFDSYGAYVWTCFGLTFVVVIVSEWRARAKQKQVYRDIEVRIKALEERQ